MTERCTQFTLIKDIILSLYSAVLQRMQQIQQQSHKSPPLTSIFKNLMHTEEDAHTCTATLAWPDACHVKPLWHHISKFKTRFSHHFRNLAAIWTPGRFIQAGFDSHPRPQEKKGSVCQSCKNTLSWTWGADRYPPIHFLYLLYPHMCW